MPTAARRRFAPARCALFAAHRCPLRRPSRVRAPAGAIAGSHRCVAENETDRQPNADPLSRPASA